MNTQQVEATQAKAWSIEDWIQDHQRLSKQITRLVNECEGLLALVEQVARSACLDQRNGKECICFSCESKRLLATLAANAQGGWQVRITHTNDSLKLTEFARKYPGWQSYAKDKRTKRAVQRAQFLGAIVVSVETRQFKSAR